MKKSLKQIVTEEIVSLLNEGGIRNMKELSKRYPMAKIYFHQDLDGVTTAIAMKEYLEQHGIKVVDAEIIQYGDKEFAIKKTDASGDIMPVLVDFAHGKPMFVIHTDHHDTQAGVEKGTATSFKPSRSNVETISQTLSPKDIFTQEDINTISMVDSADFAKYNLTPDQIMNYLFTIDRERPTSENKRKMGLVANKLLLAFKNKPDYLRNIVMRAKPSLMNILLTIKDLIKTEGYADVESLRKNQQDYIQAQKVSKNVNVEDNIIVQYGGGSMIAPGSYDRYTPFKNNPNADFIVIAWPMGMIQASCNPFKKDRALKGVNLGEIKDEVLGKFENELKSIKIPLSTIKWIAENDKNFGSQSVGFTFKDFVAIYKDSFDSSKKSENFLSMMESIMKRPFRYLSEKQMAVLDSIKVSAWDLIEANSGGHKCITNISGLNFIKRNSRPPVGKKQQKGNDDEYETPYLTLMKQIQREFVNVLKEKIKSSDEDRYEPDYEVEMVESIKRVTKSIIKSRPNRIS